MERPIKRVKRGGGVVTCKTQGCGATREGVDASWHGRLCGGCKKKDSSKRRTSNTYESWKTKVDASGTWGRAPRRDVFVDDTHFQKALDAWTQGTKRTFIQWRDGHLARKNAKGYGSKESLLKMRDAFVNRHEFDQALAFWNANHKHTESYRNALVYQHDNLGAIKAVRDKNGTNKDTRVCRHEGCSIVATFGETRQFCKTHKPGVMERTPNSGRVCSHNGCKKQPSFGLPGGVPEYCAKHARDMDDYVDVVSVLCVVDGCGVNVSYARQVGDRATHCATHGKALGYIDTKSRMCTTDGCRVKASYGVDNTRQKCGAHKADGMVDVVTIRCGEDGCVSPAKYAALGTKPKWCHRHKVRHPRIVYKPTKMCTASGCRRFADHGQFHNPTTCALHVADSCDFGLNEDTCSACNLVDILDPHTNKCEHCGDWVVASTGLPQRRVKHLFDVNNIDYIQERVVGDTKIVPDFRIDTPTHSVVVEVDEEQHKNSRYTTSSRYRSYDAERLRMLEMVEKDPRIKVFIRYNPDAYVGADNMPMEERHQVLLFTTQAAMNTPRIDTPVVSKLFYDGYTGNAPFVEL